MTSSLRLSQAVEAFLRQMTGDGRIESSISSYRRQLGLDMRGRCVKSQISRSSSPGPQPFRFRGRHTELLIRIPSERGSRRPHGSIPGAEPPPACRMKVTRSERHRALWHWWAKRSPSQSGVGLRGDGYSLDFSPR